MSVGDVQYIVVMGSTGCGKSTVGSLLAQELNADYIEGDDHHTEHNRQKMSEGIALTDEDRMPWLQGLGELMYATSVKNGRPVVASCSALRKIYRDRITRYAQAPVLFVYLYGSEALLASRLASRQGHFMNADLLDSQLATLEKPDDTERSIKVDIDQAPENIVESIKAQLKSL